VINRAFEIEILQHKIEPCIVEKNLCIIALVGENMKNHQGLSGKMFSTLGKNNVNIRAIAKVLLSETYAVINQRDVKKALNTLHERFLKTILNN
jgi:aspartokinase/homoserine dehydrogenase 1